MRLKEEAIKKGKMSKESVIAWAMQYCIKKGLLAKYFNKEIISASTAAKQMGVTEEAFRKMAML